MNFFEHQDKARKRSGLLLVLYFLSVCGIIFILYVAFFALLHLSSSPRHQVRSYALRGLPPFWDPQLFSIISFGTLCIVIGGTLFKIVQLRGGGEQVAFSLGGTRIAPDTTAAHERKLLNVVEEIAIAAGTPVPPVYLLRNEHGINAFCAGTSPMRSVIGVTQGCIDTLSRDELQGVIAHEFSHLLYGDTRLNVRLIGVLHGILSLTLMGRVLLRAGLEGGRSRSSRDNENNSTLPIIAAAFVLIIVGSIGVFFAHLIKSAVARQREFLADASAMQFTRNPLGIGGALRKIKALSEGSRITSPRAEEASHMFFANGLKSSFLSLLATHPPLNERIRRIDDQEPAPVSPPTEGSSPAHEEPRIKNEQERNAYAAGLSFLQTPSISTKKFAVEPFKVARNAGKLTLEHLGLASSIIKTIPPSLDALLRTQDGAAAVVVSLLLAVEDAPRAAQREVIRSSIRFFSDEILIRAEEERTGLSRALYFPLIELSVPALSLLSLEQRKSFLPLLREVSLSDGSFSLFDYSTTILLAHVLAPSHEKRPTITSFRSLEDPLQAVLSLLAHLGHPANSNAAQGAFGHAAGYLGLDRILIDSDKIDLIVAWKGLEEFSALKPGLKEKLLFACTKVVLHDGCITVDESEVIRAIAGCLEVPLPALYLEALG